MKKLQTVTIWLILAFILMNHITRIKYYQQFFGKVLFGYGSDYFTAYLIMADNILLFLMDLLTILLGVAALAYSDKVARDRMYSFFRYVYVMRSFLAVPIVIYSTITFAKYIFPDPVSTFITLFRDAVWITLVVFMIICKPEKRVQKVNLQDYDMVAFTTTGHRFMHYFMDLLFLLPIWMYFVQGMLSSRQNQLFQLLIFVGSFILYYFLSEAIFRQTLGKMITRSCVVSDGVELTTGRVFGRTLCRLIPFNNFSFLFGAKWHDRVSSTAVVYVDTWEQAFEEKLLVAES